MKCMKIPEICFIKYKIEDLKLSESVKDEKILDLRKRIDILVIDDEDFTPYNFLINNNFRLTYKKDIDNVRDVSEYPIILCDIRGVGKQLSNSYEGAFLIKEIKKNYPSKRVIAYTASQYDPTYNQYLEYADELVQKGLALEDWLKLLDEQIEKTIDPIFQWNNLRKKLLSKHVATIDVAKLESLFVDSYKKGKFDSFEDTANKMSGDVKGIVLEFLSSAAVKMIKG